MAALTPDELPLQRVRWQRRVRIVPADFEPIPLFELTSNPEELEAADLLLAGAEGRTPMDLSLVPAARRVSGANTSAALTAARSR